MEGFCVFNVFFCLVTLLVLATSVFANGSVDTSIRGWVSAKDKNTDEKIEKDFKHDSSSEIIMKNVKHLQINCEADFPVELIFDGYSDGKFVSSGSGTSSSTFQNDTHNVQVEKFTSYAHGFSHTGLYTCRGSEPDTKGRAVSAYVYIPRNQIFVASKTAQISSNNEPLQIPCPVSDPEASVRLLKMQNGESVIPVPSATYDPRKGFTLNDKSNVEGVYYCTANHNGMVNALEFTVVNGPVLCSKKCGLNERCEMNECRCKSAQERHFFRLESCLKKCSSDSDCPSNMACVTTIMEEKQERRDFFSDMEDWGFASFGSRRRFRDEDNEGNGSNKKRECKLACVFTDTGCRDGDSCRSENHKGACHR